VLRVSSVSKLDISGEEGCGDGLDGTGVWVRTYADGEDEEGDGVEHVGHGGGLREAARGDWMSLRRGGGCVRRGGGLQECVCWLRRGGRSGRAWYRVGNKGRNRNVRRDKEVASTRLQSQCVSATRLHQHGRGGSKLFAAVAADDAVRTRSVTVVSALARLTLRPRPRVHRHSFRTSHRTLTFSIPAHTNARSLSKSQQAIPNRQLPAYHTPHTDTMAATISHDLAWTVTKGHSATLVKRANGVQFSPTRSDHLRLKGEREPVLIHE
jgi:hypothetical protein